MPGVRALPQVPAVQVVVEAMIDIGLPKLIGGALLIAFVIGTPLYAVRQHRRAVAAEAVAADLAEQIAVRAKNAELAQAIAGRWQAKETKRTAGVEVARRDVRNAEVPVPENCRDALRPLAVAVERLFDLRKERGSTPPASVVSGRPSLATDLRTCGLRGLHCPALGSGGELPGSGPFVSRME